MEKALAVLIRQSKVYASLPIVLAITFFTLCGCSEESMSPEEAVWTLDGESSQVHYLTTKIEHVTEINKFSSSEGQQPALQGSIDVFGNAVVLMNLNDVQTNIDIRDTRMKDIVFETALLPIATISVAIDLATIDAMEEGSSTTDSIEAQLSLHGITKKIVADVIVVKHADQAMSVSTMEPILIDSQAFDLSYGVETLRMIAGLASISHTVPVYFHLNYVASSDTTAIPYTKLNEPFAPSRLEVSYDPDFGGDLTLSWSDNSYDESGFIVRRQVNDGFWHTVDNLLMGSELFTEVLPEGGEFKYKVIAVNESIPSEPSNIVDVVVIAGDPIANGKAIYDVQCAGCHGVNGEGISVFPALNMPVDITMMESSIFLTMPPANPQVCDDQCSADVASYIQTFW